MAAHTKYLTSALFAFVFWQVVYTGSAAAEAYTLCYKYKALSWQAINFYTANLTVAGLHCRPLVLLKSRCACVCRFAVVDAFAHLCAHGLHIGGCLCPPNGTHACLMRISLFIPLTDFPPVITHSPVVYLRPPPPLGSFHGTF